MSTEDLFQGFAQPPDSFTQIPFWFLNGPVDGKEWARQIEEMAAHGVRQAMPHPRFGMDRRDYLTDRYWEAFSQLVDKAQELGFALHLYDEFNWSSGPAGGRVTEKRENCALGLGMRAQRIIGPTRATFGGWEDGMYGWGRREKYLSVVLAPWVGEELDLARADYRPPPPAGEEAVSVQVPPGTWEVMVFYTIRTLHPSPLRMGNGGLIDYVSAEATADFLACTHEEYARRFGQHLGGLIPSIFYDESAPIASGPFTWAADFLEQFQERQGYDLLPLLPLLFYQGGARSEKVRVDYWDVLSALFTERHVGQMAGWCEAHGLALTGHTFEEPERWLMAGDMFRTLRQQHWPGLDSLGGYKPYHYLKPAVSVSHITGKRVVLCEGLGLMGLWGASPRMMREAYNQLAVAGCNLQVPHAFYQTIDNPKVECPPSFFEHNPYWKYYDQIAALTARQCWMNAQARHVAQVAVLYPVVSWMGDARGGRGYTYPWMIATRETEASRPDREVFEEIVDGLMAAQMDHDIIDGQALHEGVLESGRLRLGEEEYEALIVPPMTTARRADLERVLQWARQGGLVIVVGKWPTASQEAGREDADLSRLVNQLRSEARAVATPGEAFQALRWALKRDVEVLSGDPATLEISHRRTDDTEVYLISHHAPVAERVRLRLRAEGGASLWDAEEGGHYHLDAHQSQGVTDVSLHLGPDEAVYVVLERETVSPEAAALSSLPPWRLGREPRIVPLEGPWTFLPVPTELDRDWRCEVGPQEVELPVFRTRELSHQPQDLPVPGDAERGFSALRPVDTEVALWGQWFRPEYDDSAWETAHCLRGPLLFDDPGSRLFRMVIPPGATALRLPLPVEKEYALYLNGELTRTVLGREVRDSGWLEIPPHPPGTGLLALECASMAPGFGLTGPLVFRCEPAEVDLRSWTDLGLWWYSGRGLYRTNLLWNGSADAWNSERRVTVNLGEVRECAELWVNGQLAGTRIWPPYRVEITDLLQEGENELAVVVANLLANRFAWDEWGTRGRGETLDSGLLGPVRLEIW